MSLIPASTFAFSMEPHVGNGRSRVPPRGPAAPPGSLDRLRRRQLDARVESDSEGYAARQGATGGRADNASRSQGHRPTRAAARLRDSLPRQHRVRVQGRTRPGDEPPPRRLRRHRGRSTRARSSLGARLGTPGPGERAARAVSSW